MYRTNSMTYQTKTPPLQGRAAFLKNTNNMLKASKNNLHLSNRFCTFEVTSELKQFSSFFTKHNSAFGHIGVSPLPYRYFDSGVSDPDAPFITNSLRMTPDKEKVHTLLQGSGVCFTHTVNTFFPTPIPFRHAS